MSIEKIIVSIIGGIFQGIASSFILKIQIKSTNKEIVKKIFPLLSLYSIISLLFIPNQFRFIYFLFLTVITLRYIFKIKDKKNILYSFNMMIIISVSEIIISLFLVLCGITSNDIVDNYFYNLLANILISIFTLVISSLKLIRTTLNKIINIFEKNNNLLNYFYIFIVILYLIVLKNGLEFLLKSNYYINILFMACVILIITIIIRNEFKYDKIKDEYKNMLNHVTKYEKIITDQGKANHEFKNQLMVIRGYAQMNSPKLIEYLDSVIKDSKKTHSSYLISQLNKFPAGGIKGLLYYKLSTMDDENIKHELNVESGVKIRLDTLGTETYKNITKILGVLFDNAIDACKKSKEKKIIIDVVKKTNSVTFSIYNTYKGKIDMDKIGTGFTTKGFGHGYGLRLVKDIVENSNIFEIENSLEDEYYVTKLTIKTKNRQIKKKK